jgi:putative nucleotidyltransferase with HDIG domain
MKKIDSLFLIAKMLSENETIYTHGRRVARFACAIAQKMSYSEADIKHIHFAAIVHDIGKIKIPEEILNKRGALDDNEFVIMRKHPELGYHLLKDIRPESIAAEVALQHHERLNGSGYPFGLRAKDINPVTRIIAVADVVDTMVSPQVYRPTLTIKEASQEIKQNSGLLYDPEVVAASLALIEKGEITI